MTDQTPAVFYSIANQRAETRALAFGFLAVALATPFWIDWELAWPLSLMFVVLAVWFLIRPGKPRSLLEVDATRLSVPGEGRIKVRYFALADISRVALVGPQKRRELRLELASGERTTIPLGLRINDADSLERFLRAHLPGTIAVECEKPATWQEDVRGDY